MNALTRKLATVGSAVAMAASSLLLASSPASAAPSVCNSITCAGLDPAQTVCQNDARTVLTSSTGVELRYSPYCRAAWARKSSAVAGHSYRAVNGRYEQWTVTPNTSGGTVWTRMVDVKDIPSYAADYRPDGTHASDTGWFN
ncbi:hypothetical protein ASC82_07545 [Streptomyces sp. Root431]|uniref:DUF2690 domain-containing protein n=1 Tax=Streptomyces sp. Root431 TaxID=1736535 RepID=UPI0006FC0E13|nr:DUF2690 domain-containing protein [Streptomyces sp. Root431]KQX13781.1 hypothetical protein ASC82_07545 [Streptomyces sp. Root431]